ncbi:HDOD domain-containing protein [Modestobacter sp. I12A-02628]|uniref:HDOD domain-containing protein n=2 Tax=Goekera deserti TaxID=2497753 RepID=A0A7K3WJ96_9ACTN|nr:HDOD domain-containing protein [Goekera deserti]NDI46616.1 HDOD domain-containing protein [Goekera deserti]NEL56372.1 HDOD domain-containing protein [Goekera deserti]
MAAQCPVAAQVVATTNSTEAGAEDLARVLGADVALAGRVMKLANSAYYGMGGRVCSLRGAVTVVGFATVRSLATVALTGLARPGGLPADVARTSTHLALAASAVAPRLGRRAQDALCTGLLTQLGAALLYAEDPDGYAALVDAEPTAAGRRTAELRRYGVHAPRLTALALERWGFPPTLLSPMQQVDDLSSLDGALLRTAIEMTARILATDHQAVPMELLSCGRLRDDAVPALLQRVAADTEELRAALFGTTVA